MENTGIIIQGKQEPIKEELSLREWIFQRIQPYVGGRVLEVDKGEGQIAPFLLKRNIQTDVMPVDLIDAAFDATYNHLTAIFNLVIALHTEQTMINDPKFIINCARLLQPGGLLVIQFPFSTALYEGLAAGYQQWKWCNGNLLDKLIKGNFQVLKMRCYIITDNQLSSSPPSLNYRDRVTVFSKALASGFYHDGLRAIAVCQKL